MLPDYLIKAMRDDDISFKRDNSKFFSLPEYNPETHYLDLTHDNYYRALIVLRHYIKVSSDYYFSVIQKAKNVDLFMITPSISSPMGPGSDSEVIPIKFGKFNSFLVDSSQFGFEPLLMNGFDKVYCYLPSLRGENPDKRHLNQFFHCEAEIKGNIELLIPIIEGYVKILAETLLNMPAILEKISKNNNITKEALGKITNADSFPEMKFDEVVDLLIKNGKQDCINITSSGRDITSEGEIALLEILKLQIPIWIKNYDRGRVAFYQKPYPDNKNKVINADLLFPPLIKDSFGGEIVGCGQRQDNPEELLESMKMQNISSQPYDWYIDLRKQPGYAPTSGFGLGIERFITWSLCQNDIKYAIPYPRLKDIFTCP